MHNCLEKFDRLIKVSSEHLEYLRGTIYETYAREQLQLLLIEREKFIALMSLSN